MPEPMWISVASDDDPEEKTRAQHQAQKAFLDQFDFAGVPLSRAIAWARNAATEVLEEAEQYSEGLLVIGASSRSSLPQGQLGATSAAIINACPSSVLIVKPTRTVATRSSKARA